VNAVRIPSLDEMARALWELEPRDLTWYELLDAATKESPSGIAERAQLHGIRGKAHLIALRLFADPLPAPRPPMGAEWGEVAPGAILEALHALLPGFDFQVSEPNGLGSSYASVVVKARRAKGALELTDYTLMDDRTTGLAIVEFVRMLRADAIRAYGLDKAFEAEWDRARYEAREQTIKGVLGLIESTRVWVQPEGDIDDESGYLEPLTPEMARLAARVRGDG
jgi:hypothetical protein